MDIPGATQGDEPAGACQPGGDDGTFPSMAGLVFEVTQEQDGGFCAECLSENIFAEGDTWDALRENVRESVRGFYFDQPPTPRQIRLHRASGMARCAVTSSRRSPISPMRMGDAMEDAAADNSAHCGPVPQNF